MFNCYKIWLHLVFISIGLMTLACENNKKTEKKSPAVEKPKDDRTTSRDSRDDDARRGAARDSDDCESDRDFDDEQEESRSDRNKTSAAKKSTKASENQDREKDTSLLLSEDEHHSDTRASDKDDDHDDSVVGDKKTSSKNQKTVSKKSKCDKNEEEAEEKDSVSFSEIMNPERLEECHKKNQVYDREKKTCHVAELTMDWCTIDGIYKKFGVLEQKIKDKFENLGEVVEKTTKYEANKDKWIIDQCGEDGKTRYVFLVMPTSKGGVKKIKINIIQG